MQSIVRPVGERVPKTPILIRFDDGPSTFSTFLRMEEARVLLQALSDAVAIEDERRAAALAMAHITPEAP